jgi:hypothetical protein
MNLYIQIENGQPINHPAYEDNLLAAFSLIPTNWEPFIRVEFPTLGKFEKWDDPDITYEKINGVWTDVYHVIAMSAEEKTAKIDERKANWAALPQRDNFSAWTFNEEILWYEPPIPRPTDREVMWSGANNGWVDRPPKPDDGKTYTLDFYTSSWVEVTQ